MFHSPLYSIDFIASGIMLATGFIIVLFFPPIFNFIIIPRIEKKLGKKLQFPSIHYRIVPSNRYFAKSLDISLYIVIKYITYKITKNPDECRLLDKSKLALKYANYPITMASRFEIVMSFIVIIDTLLCIVSGIVSYL
jgi:hypothetical protein